MRNLLITSAFLVMALLLYQAVADSEDGLKQQLEQAKQHKNNYIKGIDS